MMTAASVTKAYGRPTTDSGFYTTPATSRKAPPPGNGSADDGQHSPSHVPLHLPDLDKPSPSPLTDKPTNGTDSSYVSGTPTPDKDKGTLAQKLFKRTPKKLCIFDQDIPDPVKNRFHDLYVLFNEPLYRYLRKHGVTLTAISIKLKYAGESEATANPWIIVQCDERASKRVRRFFNQQQIKAQYQPRDTKFPDVNFGLLVHATPPKQMATDSEPYIYGDMGSGAPTLCGKPIKICTSGETRLATLGGIIKVVSRERSQLYGMTAGHIIPRETFAQDVMDKHDHTYRKRSTEDRFSAVNNTSMIAAPEDGRTNKASMTDDQSRDGENDHDEGSEQGDEEYEYELDLGAVDDQKEKSSIDPAALSQRLRRSDLLQTRWPKLGHLSSVSHQPASKHDLDWALIKLEDPSLYRPNLLVFPESTYEFGVSARLIEGPRRLTRATRSRDVLLLSGMAGLKRGKLATSFGYLMIGPVKQFNEVYNVSMSDGSVIDAGDCGSWVVDSVTHEVYGHVIASDAFGDAYVIPLDNTFRDIRQQLAADQVCLPTEREVLKWIERRNNIVLPSSSSDLPPPTAPSGSLQFPSCLGNYPDPTAPSGSLQFPSYLGNYPEPTALSVPFQFLSYLGNYPGPIAPSGSFQFSSYLGNYLDPTASSFPTRGTIFDNEHRADQRSLFPLPNWTPKAVRPVPKNPPLAGSMIVTKNHTDSSRRARRVRRKYRDPDIGQGKGSLESSSDSAYSRTLPSLTEASSGRFSSESPEEASLPE